MKKFSLQTWINKLLLVVVRFPFTLLFLIGLSILCHLAIQKVSVDISDRVWAFFILGVLLNVAVTLFLEKFEKSIFRISFNLISTILLAVYCFTLPEKLLEYQYIQIVVLGIVFALSVFFVSFLKKNNEIPFWNFSKEIIFQLIISYAFASVFFGGLGLAVLSLDKLFNINIEPRVYGDLSILSFILFAPIYFLSNVPDEIEKRKQEVTFNKIIKIFGLYILLPILAVYTLILYVYLIQIIFKWQLPNGWVSTLVSALGIGGFVCIMILHPLYLSKENKFVDRFSRLFPALLFPLLILMTIGIVRRIADYGLTINRMYVLILNLWFYGISIYLFVKQSKQVKGIIISFAAVAFLSSVGPWSVFCITRSSLKTQLKKELTDAHLIKNDKIILNRNKTEKIDSLTLIKTTETIRYLVKVYGSESLQQYFSISIKNKSAFDLLEMMNLESVSDDVNHYFNLHLSNNSNIYSTDSYKTFVDLTVCEVENHSDRKKNVCENNQMKVDLQNGNLIVTDKSKSDSTFTIQLGEKIQQLIKEKKENGKDTLSIDKMTLVGPNYKLIMTTINGKNYALRNKIILTNFNAYLFLQLEK